MKNTTEPKTITIKNATGKIVKGILIFGIVTVYFSTDNVTIDNSKKNQGINLESEEYGFYSTSYLRNLREINPDDFDKTFLEIYDKSIINYKDKQYNSDSIYISQLEDGTVHLIDSNNNKVDFITKESLTSKRVNTMLWKDSSIFYKMYKLGLIKDENIIIPDNITEIIICWNGAKHYQTVKQIAEKKTTKAYQNKYGGK